MLLQPLPLYASDDVILCPAGFRCIPDDIIEKWAVILKDSRCKDLALDAVEKGQPTKDFKVTTSPYRIIVTKNGQVYSQENTETNIKWCSTKLNLITKSKVTVQIRDEVPTVTPVWGFRLRLRLALNVQPRALWSGDARPFVEPALAVEPFFIRDFHLLTWAGYDTFGLGVGMDLTRNANIYLGVGGRWANAEVGPTLGLSLSFN